MLNNAMNKLPTPISPKNTSAQSPLLSQVPKYCVCVLEKLSKLITGLVNSMKRILDLLINAENVNCALLAPSPHDECTIIIIST